MNAVSGHDLPWMPLVEPRSVRSLGEDLPPPRPLYFTHIPFILAFTGAISWGLGSEDSMVLASAVGGAIGGYMLIDWLFRGATRFSTVIAFSLLIGYGLGAFNTWATTSRGGLTLGEYLGYDDAVLAHGMAAVLLSCALLTLVGELFERPLFGRDFRIRPDRRIYSFIYIGTILVLGALASGAFTYNGVEATDSGEIGVVKTFLLWVFSPLVALSVTVFLTTPHGTLHKKLVGAAALVLLLLLVVTGRRAIIYTVMETIFLARISGFRLKASFSRKVITSGLVFVFVVSGVLFFILLRNAGYGGGPKTHRSLIERVVLVNEWIVEGSAWQKAVTATQSNIETRTFVLGFFANVLEGSSTHTPGLGEDAIGLIQIAVPSVLYPGKNRFFSEEELTDQLFGFAYKDEANSVLTGGAADFGLAGALLYPLAVAWIFKLFTDFALWRLNQFSILMIVLANVYCCLQAENTLTSFVDTIFHGLLFSIAVMAFFALPRLRFQR
jgi:hypothetical protein